MTTKRCHIVASITLEVVTDYLEILAFVCQVKHSQRDFSLAACADDVKVFWLTLQEYLAATYPVRLFGLDTPERLHQLQPFHSLWKRMVVQFASCLMEDENVFEGFCQIVLASDDGTGSYSELVQDFVTL